MIRIIRAAGWACVVVLALLSLLPADDMIRTGVGGKIEHAFAYAGTALLLSFGYNRLLPIAGGLVVYAAALEKLQVLSLGRHSALGDWIASSTGALLGVAAAYAATAAWQLVQAKHRLRT